MIIPSGYAQVNLRFTGADIPTGAEMTFGVNNTVTGWSPEAGINEVGNAIGASDLPDAWNTACTLSSILWKSGPNATGPSAEVSTSYVGTVTGDSDPPQTAMLIRKNTALGGRAGRGRMYQPGVPEAFVNGAGELTGTTATIITALYADFLTILGGSDIPMVLLHAEGSPITTPTTVTSLEVDARCATQRRRNRR
jgi:hypothetical protein